MTDGRPPAATGSRWVDDALSASKPAVFWTDELVGPELTGWPGSGGYDLAIVGGGFTGLWAAIEAAQDDPGRRIILLEAESVAFGASGRNGGFCDASLTHGLEQGLSRWPNEISALIRMGNENLDAIEATVRDHDIEAGFERVDDIAAAIEPWHVDDLQESIETHERFAIPATLLDAGATRNRLDSPTYLGSLVTSKTLALVDPGRLAAGLAELATSLGVVIAEKSGVTEIAPEGQQVVLGTMRGSIRADRAIVATNAYRGPVARSRRWIIPVYDHVLMTEPLSASQMAAVGWQGREGVSDNGNRFHYYRLTEDNRILWGGWDATYHLNNRVSPALDDRPETHRLLAEHFAQTFPQLEGLTFTHRWGGPIATTSRFTATWGRDLGGRLVWVGGYTGLGVGASRFGARVALDMVDGLSTERTALKMVRRKPFPFPPEPLRWMAVTMTKRAIVAADENGGERGPWLGLLDRFGMGFDS